ncbi:MAG: hypothetical protein DRN21_05305 [Thermoplasmata archaeon]|nr:MAG: hypothetical protein DRN21_05305 [Thermoplasmata archaeon]
MGKISDPQIVYCFREKAGINSAKNRGVKLAKGRYVAFWGSDDLWIRKHFSPSRSILKHTEMYEQYLPSRLTWAQMDSE